MTTTNIWRESCAIVGVGSFVVGAWARARPSHPGSSARGQPRQSSRARAPGRLSRCAARAGGIFGALLGPVFYAFETTNPAQADLPLRMQLRLAGRDIAARSRTWGKNFGVIGGLFSVSECFVAKVRGARRAGCASDIRLLTPKYLPRTCATSSAEQTRAAHDMWNPVIGGCITGGGLAARGGPQACAFGCAGFAAFSLAIEAAGFGQHGSHGGDE